MVISTATLDGLPNAMVISTATLDGLPSSRYVLMKEFNDQHIYFFTNYNSRKGSEILENPNVAALFYWPMLRKQVRIEGKATKAPAEKNRDYFSVRDIASQ